MFFISSLKTVSFGIFLEDKKFELIYLIIF